VQGEEKEEGEEEEEEEEEEEVAAVIVGVGLARYLTGSSATSPQCGTC
jgi:hypothetical protein